MDPDFQDRVITFFAPISSSVPVRKVGTEIEKRGKTGFSEDSLQSRKVSITEGHISKDFRTLKVVILPLLFFTGAS